jgi:hypothetical protein
LGNAYYYSFQQLVVIFRLFPEALKVYMKNEINEQLRILHNAGLHIVMIVKCKRLCSWEGQLFQQNF